MLDKTNQKLRGYVYNLGLLFENTAYRFSQNTALFLDGQVITYGELASASAKMARLLLSRGVSRGSIVCISGKKTFQTYSTLLACLRIGAGYAVLDDASPLERLDRIVATCEPSLLALDQELAQRVLNHPSLNCYSSIVWDRTLEKELDGMSSEPLVETLKVTGEDIAYLMFTSGSTGFPKGVVINHSNILNFIEWSRACFRITPEDVLTGVNPLYFDNSVFDLYSSLMTGAALASFDRLTVRDPGKILKAIDYCRCTVWFSVPSMLIFLSTMRVLGPSAFQSITRIGFGGEGYPKPKLKQLFECFGHRARIINVYGPTECTCICSAYDVTAEDFEDMQTLSPIGELAPNFSGLILDGDRQVAPGEVGELCLLGPNVGKGYFNNPQKSSSAYVQNPLNKSSREIMYRTGDLVRRSPEKGWIYFVGRIDFQVKHMGYRIELQEIEAALNRLEYVEEAAVVHGEVDGFGRIEAMIAVLEEVEEQQALADVRKYVPDYMVPQRIRVVEVLPKNQNGKIDRPRIRNILF